MSQPFPGAIGIDFGTTKSWVSIPPVDTIQILTLFGHCSCVGVWKNDRVEIIPNELGSRTTHSYVSFSDTEPLIGDAAKNRATMNPTHT